MQLTLLSAISTIFFVVFFLGVLWWTLRLDPELVRLLSEMPLKTTGSAAVQEEENHA